MIVYENIQAHTPASFYNQKVEENPIHAFDLCHNGQGYGCFPQEF